MGGAALAAALPSLIRRPDIPARDNGVLEKKKKKKEKKKRRFFLSNRA